MMQYDSRPKYLNLFKIKLPVTGVISIFHRLTGILLFAFIPVSLYFLQLSVKDAASFQQLSVLMLSPLSRFFILLMLWSLVHHLITGLRFLLIDMEFFLSRQSSRASAWGVVIVEALVMVTVIAGLFL
ncbi:MAG: succinate dehydrogenase, cytochrome b556 subunit [Gammaproteobacteria bacterium]|nr:succinate dehydrogenase, cytochrome b556 subunit [Gammaproteobacteria bacterium]